MSQGFVNQQFSNGLTTTGTGTVMVLQQGPTINQPNIVGVTNNSSAAAGSVGEIIKSTVTGVNCPTGTNTNVTSITLTTGNWILWGNVNLSGSGAGVWTSNFLGINSVSATFPAITLYVGDNNTAGFGGSATQGYLAPPFDAELSGSTTYYLIAQPNFTTGTVGAAGGIYAQRIR